MKRFRRDEGIALVWLAITLVLLIGMAGFGLDLGWIYLNTARTQKAVDAAALAGVVNLPGFIAQANIDASGQPGAPDPTASAMTADRGTAAIEFAFAIVVLLMLALGAYEWGTGFSDRISMTAAVREGGRVGSAAGDLPDADCRIIEASAGALNGVSGNSVKQLWIYESDMDGTVTLNRQIYRPAAAAEPGLTCTGGTWFLMSAGWPPASRVNSGSNRDWIGVKVIIDHEWRTGFLWWDGTVEWEEDAVFHLEPDVVS